MNVWPAVLGLACLVGTAGCPRQLAPPVAIGTPSPNAAFWPEDGEFHVAVVLPVSGGSDRGVFPALEWAAKQINASGGPVGHRITVDAVDLQDVTDSTFLRTLAEATAANPKYVAAIGPQLSATAPDIVPAFIAKKKVIVTPYAAAASLTRQFGGLKYFWRTVVPATAEMRFLLGWAKSKGMDRAGLITQDNAFGSSWFDFFGFTATELKLTVAGLDRKFELTANPDPDCMRATKAVLDTNPGFVLIAFADVANTACAINAVRDLSPGTPIIIADTFTDLIYEQVPKEKLIGVITDPGKSPNNRFDEEYTSEFGSFNDAAGQAYDALLLIALGLQRSKGEGGEALADGIRDIVLTRGGQKTDWTADGIKLAFELISAATQPATGVSPREIPTILEVPDGGPIPKAAAPDAGAAGIVGRLPDISGASSNLTYDSETLTDPLEVTITIKSYTEDGTWEGNEVFTQAIGLKANSRSAVNQFAQLTKEQLVNDTKSKATFEAPARTGLKVLLVATSKTFANYRHQSDVLSVYQTLIKNGVSADDIILIINDDLVAEPPSLGVVTATVDGNDLYQGAKKDYTLGNLTPEDLVHIIEGNVTPATPTVFKTGPGDNILIYMSGHGGTEGPYIGAGDASGKGAGFFRPAMLLSTLVNLRAQNKARYVLLWIEACESGVLLDSVVTPGTAIVTAANPVESSFATNWNMARQYWHSDQFSFALGTMLASEGAKDITLTKHWNTLFDETRGSHVHVVNRLGVDMDNITLKEFIYP